MTDYEITESMLRFGGGFVQHLARAFRAADSDNQRRIKATWPEYWAKYEEFARFNESKLNGA